MPAKRQKNISVDKTFIGADAVSIEKRITNATFPKVGRN